MHAPALMNVLRLIPGIGPKRVRKLLPVLKASNSRSDFISFLRKELAEKPGGRHLADALEAADPTAPDVLAVIENVLRSVTRLSIELKRGSKYLRGAKLMDTILEQAEGTATLQDVISSWALTSNDARPEDNIECVSVSTIHAAKGREWPVVYIPQLVDDHFPHSKSTTDAQIAEEGRIFYVAVTRSKKYLYLSHTASGAAGANTSATPSPFLDLPGVRGLLKHCGSVS